MGKSNARVASMLAGLQDAAILNEFRATLAWFGYTSPHRLRKYHSVAMIATYTKKNGHRSQ